MEQFVISVDTTSGFFRHEMEQRGIEYVPMAYIIDGQSHYKVYNSHEEEDGFFLLEGNPITSAINIQEHEEHFSSIIEQHKCDVIHFSLSSGVSSTYSNALSAAHEINAQGGNKVLVLDTLNLAGGTRILVERAIALRDSGVDAMQAFLELEQQKLNIHHYFLMDDLTSLKRGGRLWGERAIIAKCVKLQHILKCDRDGRFVVVKRLLGQRKAREELMQYIAKLGKELERQTIYVAYSTDASMAGEIACEIEQRFGSKAYICRLGAGANTQFGAGAVLVAFVGEQR